MSIPKSYWITDLDGDRIIVMVLKEFPFGKLSCVDEDGESLVCDQSQIDWSSEF